jgi:hypothetical protein
MCATIDSIVPTDLVTGFGETSSVDAFFSTNDCDGNGTPDDPEPFGEHSALVTISANLIPNIQSPPAPAYVEFTGYTIEYFPSAANATLGVPAPPLTTQPFSESWKVSADETVTKTLAFVSIATKNEFATTGGTVFPANYTARYTISGKTQFNQDIVLVGSASFSIGDFNMCP